MDDRILRHLVTEANGFVSKTLWAELLRLGLAVRAVVRSANVWIDDFERALVGSIDSGKDWAAVLGEMGSDSSLFTPANEFESDPIYPLFICRLCPGRFLMTAISAQVATFTSSEIIL